MIVGCAISVPSSPRTQDPNFYKELVNPDEAPHDGSPLCISRPKTNYPKDILDDMNSDEHGVGSPIFDLKDLPTEFVNSILANGESV